MKRLFFVYLILSFSCNLSADKIVSDNVILTDTVKPNTPSAQIFIDSEIDKKSSMFGVWQLVNDENPIFEIKKDSIFYIDQFVNYKYSIKDDFITIFYSDNIYKGRITLDKDTLFMKNQEQEDKYIRVKD